MFSYEEWVVEHSDDVCDYMYRNGYEYGSRWDGEFDEICESEYSKYCDEYVVEIEMHRE